MIFLFKLAIYLTNYRKECILGPIFKFFEVIFELLLPTLMALIINNGVAGHDIGYVLKIGGLMMLMTLCGYCSTFICQRFAARASQGFGTVLRNAVFKRILAFSYAQIDQFGASSLTNRITNDINQLQQLVAMTIRLITRAPFICVGAIIMSFFLDVKLALILLAATPVLGAIIFLITQKAAPLYRRYQQKLDRLAAILRENLSGVRVIRAFSKAVAEKKRFHTACGELVNTGLNIGTISSLFNPLTSFVVNMVIVLILWTGGMQIDAGRLSQGQIIAFINYVGQILAALLVVSNLIILFTKSMASAARINEILDTKPEMTDTRENIQKGPDPGTPAIQFEDVSFGYNPTGDHALDHICIKIEPGETIGIIGGTGSGKSTFVSLIARFYDASSGNVLVDGINVKDYSSEKLRQKVGVVPQQALLFSGTVAENIRWGKANADMQMIVAAAHTAQADEFINKLEHGYDTLLQRGATNLSGGQRQRLTIARALVANPDILILDDATSALDFMTDARLRKAIRENNRTKTVLLVSQRVSVVKHADRIVVFEDGKIAGIGTHDTLFQQCGTYREICLSQLADGEARA